MAEQSTPYVGRSLRRREDLKFLTGRGRYVDDIALPGVLYLAILRSPHAHARITGIDLSAARGADGVRLALADADLTGEIGNIKPKRVIPGTVIPDRPAIASIGFVSSANTLRWLSPRRGKRPRTHRHYL